MDKVFKNGPSKICGRQLLKTFFKGCLSEMLLDPFLNTRTHLSFHFMEKRDPKGQASSMVLMRRALSELREAISFHFSRIFDRHGCCVTFVF